MPEMLHVVFLMVRSCLGYFFIPAKVPGQVKYPWRHPCACGLKAGYHPGLDGAGGQAFIGVLLGTFNYNYILSLSFSSCLNFIGGFKLES